MPKTKYTPGFIYIAGNEQIPYVIKIGLTEGELLGRMKGLSNPTGVPGKYHAIWAKEVACIEIAEELIQYLLRDYRFQREKEFFEISVKQAKKVSEYVIKTIFETKIIKPKFSSKDWEFILNSDKYPPFVQTLIRKCVQEGRMGEPNRKRFGTLRFNFGGLTNISPYIIKSGINVVIHCDKKKGKRIINNIFKNQSLKLKEWKSGYSLVLSDKKAATVFFDWLKLGKMPKQKKIVIRNL